jgi:hypothetical protein
LKREDIMSTEASWMRKIGWVPGAAHIHYVPWGPGGRQTSVDSLRARRRAVYELRGLVKSMPPQAEVDPKRLELNVVKRQWKPGKPFVVLSFGHCIGSAKSILRGV